MAAANPATHLPTTSFVPLHYACTVGRVDIVKYIVEANEELLKLNTSCGYLPLHIACLGGNCNVVNCILARSDHGVSLRIDGKLPFDLLLSELANCDRDSLEFVEAVGRLLHANPAVVVGSLRS
jgi:ankyrin repeat protein